MRRSAQKQTESDSASNPASSTKARTESTRTPRPSPAAPSSARCPTSMKPLFAASLVAGTAFALWRVATHRRVKAYVSDGVIDWLGARC